MIGLNQPMTPALHDYMNAQYAMFHEVSRKAFESAQKVSELHTRIVKSAWENSLKSVQQVAVSRDPYEAVSIVAAQAQPASERLRQYQQELVNIAASTQQEFAKTAESHMPNTSRTASAVADAVARTAKDQVSQIAARQKAAADTAAATVVTAATAAAGGKTGQKQPI
jgi:phasin family protein